MLTRRCRQGVVIAFSTRLRAAGLQEDITTIAAASGVRRFAATLTVSCNKAIFTPCTVCAKQPIPTWSIRAKQVVDDKKKHIILFRNAVIEIHGVPVFYTPLIWEPDPDVKRQSGLLIPEINVSSLRGVSYEQPYLQVISPSEDLVLKVRRSTPKVNPFLNVDWRKRFYTRRHRRALFNYTYDRKTSIPEGEKLGNYNARTATSRPKGLFALDRQLAMGLHGRAAFPTR